MPSREASRDSRLTSITRRQLGSITATSARLAATAGSSLTTACYRIFGAGEGAGEGLISNVDLRQIGAGDLQGAVLRNADDHFVPAHGDGSGSRVEERRSSRRTLRQAA